MSYGPSFKWEVQLTHGHFPPLLSISQSFLLIARGGEKCKSRAPKRRDPKKTEAREFEKTQEDCEEAAQEEEGLHIRRCARYLICLFFVKTFQLPPTPLFFLCSCRSK